jgi:hypothetical protein
MLRAGPEGTDCRNSQHAEIPLTLNRVGAGVNDGRFLKTIEEAVQVVSERIVRGAKASDGSRRALRLQDIEEDQRS